MATRVLRFHGFGGPISLVVDDRDTGEVHLVRLFVGDADFDRTVRDTLMHDSEFDFISESGGDVCVRSRDIVVVGTSGIHIVYVAGARVFLVGDDASYIEKRGVLRCLEKELMRGAGPAWWRDYRLVRFVSLGRAKVAQ
jgi:hypothetical protein